MNDNKTRAEELAAAIAHYLRTSAELIRAADRAEEYSSHENCLALDKAVEADSAAGNRLAHVLNQFTREEADRLQKQIDEQRRKL
jgi:hypothetical protein